MSGNPGARAEAERRKADSLHRFEELKFLLDMGTAAGDAVRRLDFPNITAAATFLRKHGRPDLARKISLEAGRADPFSDLWVRNLLALQSLTEHSQNRTRS